eukprot:TRINITY_DN7472_c0_g1_i1.p1 TRINITY_DN7472_c0_g1~~TRINITY_DN7472_c0_g1_i1.p1  ORF type:complete len:126 (+),score=33.43 TRINITY_DN7472_c0_g1_i1:69-446(+)
MAKVAVQTINSASLLVNNVDQWVDVGAGIIVYVVFGKEATVDKLPILVETLLAQETQWDDTANKKVSVLESGGDVLIVPQASMIGKLKAKKPQYHTLIDKAKGAELYLALVEEFKKQRSHNTTPL